MKFCVISPVAGLYRYAALSNIHLVLAHVNDIRYMEFYRQRRKAGDTIILDNGAYEEGESVSDTQLINAVEFYNPQWLVCPDKLFCHWEKTYGMTKDFLDRYQNYMAGRDIKFMAIPQTTRGDILSWAEGMLRICDELPIDGIGLPRALVTHYYPDPRTRINACRFVKSRYPHLYIHAFGMANGDPEELKGLEKEGCDSCDSSAPVWRAWSMNYGLDDYHRELWDKMGGPCRFDAPLPISIQYLNRIEANLKECGVNASSNR